MAELLSQLDGVAVVGQAEDAPSAQKGIQTTNPDVAIVDIQMPGGNGIDVVRNVKRGRLGGPSFIMYTNYGLPQYRKASAEAGADFFFDKATDSRALADAIRMLAAKRSATPPTSA